MSFTFYKETKIYIFTPAGEVTGGIELLHQLCDILNRHNMDAYIVYQGDKEHKIPSDYKKYDIKLAYDYEDSEKNIIVLPEVYIHELNTIKKAQVLIWWLSVDNYFYSSHGIFFDTVKFNFSFAIERLIKETIKKILFMKVPKKYSINKLRKNNLVRYNACQCAYALDFLAKREFSNLTYLSDYINEDYMQYSSLLESKENFVIYNPKKGFKFTKKLINAAPDLQWVPLQNMTRSEVRKTMSRAKVYIDFGNFPGKDRMPREAAMCGCCIITGKLGAAGFHEDLPINEEFKFEQTTKDISKIVTKIRFELENYETEIEKYENYRSLILKEKIKFEQDALSLLSNGGE